MAENRTLEQRIKFDHGLKVGRSLVEFRRGDRTRKALVHITARKVIYLAEPTEHDMYASWRRIRGDACTGEPGLFTWPARNADFMAQFAGEPVATIDV